mgnify:CR=1 FL=1
MTGKVKRVATWALAAGVLGAGLYFGAGPIAKPVATWLVKQSAVPSAKPGQEARTSVAAPEMKPEAMQVRERRTAMEADLAGFEARLERERFRPMREFVMVLEARLAAVEARCR